MSIDDEIKLAMDYLKEKRGIKFINDKNSLTTGYKEIYLGRYCFLISLEDLNLVIAEGRSQFPQNKYMEMDSREHVAAMQAYYATEAMQVKK